MSAGSKFPLAPGEKAPQIMEAAYAREGGPLPERTTRRSATTCSARRAWTYTYLHPEVLVENCTIDHGTLILNNKENREEYQVLILPAGNVLSAAAAKKIKEFYDQGGTVIATDSSPPNPRSSAKTRKCSRPWQTSSASSKDEPLEGRCQAGAGPPELLRLLVLREEERRGRPGLLFAEHSSVAAGFNIVRLALPVRDVTFQEPLGELRDGAEYEGALTYIHKVKDGRDIYFFANSSPKDVDTKVVLRGHKTLTIWNPHTGAQEPAEARPGTDGQPMTTVRLKLASVSSLFLVSD